MGVNAGTDPSTHRQQPDSENKFFEGQNDSSVSTMREECVMWENQVMELKFELQSLRHEFKDTMTQNEIRHQQQLQERNDLKKRLQVW